MPVARLSWPRAPESLGASTPIPPVDRSSPTASGDAPIHAFTADGQHDAGGVPGSRGPIGEGLPDEVCVVVVVDHVRTGAV